jgi:hypothetical protein
MRTEVSNILVMSKKPIAGRRRVGDPELVGWVGVYPQEAAGGHGYRIMAFDLPKRVIENNWDPVGSELHREELMVEELDQIDAAVAKLGGLPETLDATWKVDYPL